jgi:hypothetical protein
MAVGGLTKLVRFVRYLTAEKGGIKGVGISGYFAVWATVCLLLLPCFILLKHPFAWLYPEDCTGKEEGNPTTGTSPVDREKKDNP